MGFYGFFVSFTSSPQPHSPPHPFGWPSALAIYPQKKMNNKKLTKQSIGSISLWKLWCVSVSHSVPFWPHIFSCKCSLHWVVGLVQGLWLLLLSQCWICPRVLLSYPFVACVMEILKVWICKTHLFHTLQQFINEVDFGGGPTQSPRSRPGLVKSSRVGQSVTSPTPIPLGEFSQIAPASSHSATAG